MISALIDIASAEPTAIGQIEISVPEPLCIPMVTPQIEPTQEPYTTEDKELIARVVYAEARGESAEGKIAVACVVLNRQKASGKSIKSIVFAPHQFAISKTYDTECMDAVEEAIEDNSYPDNMLYFQVADMQHWTNRPSIVRYIRIGRHTFYVNEN